MTLTYDLGDPGAPKGHALLYYRARADHSRCYATYVICLPVAIDLVKYMPPLLAPHVAGMNAQEMSAFAFPPIPEDIGGGQRLEALAQARSDDLLYGGTVDTTQVPNLLATVNDAVQEYAQAYQTLVGATADAVEEHQEQISELGVSDVIYELMGERDRLAEMAQLTGKLRFAAEGGDVRQVEEAEREIRSLAKYLPDHWKVDALVRAAKTSTASGGELAGLYLDRCYKLADEDYLRLKVIEERIQELELGETGGQV